MYITGNWCTNTLQNCHIYIIKGFHTEKGAEVTCHFDVCLQKDSKQCCDATKLELDYTLGSGY